MIHPLADVEDPAALGSGVKVWRWSHIRAGALIGAGVSVGQCCYVGEGVAIGDESRVQNCVSVYPGVTIGRRVLVGPCVAFTNDKYPRVRAPGEEWDIRETVVEDDVGIGANATIVCGVRLGAGCLIGAGAVITKDVPPGALVTGVW